MQPFHTLFSSASPPLLAAENVTCTQITKSPWYISFQKCIYCLDSSAKLTPIWPEATEADWQVVRCGHCAGLQTRPGGDNRIIQSQVGTEFDFAPYYSEDYQPYHKPTKPSSWRRRWLTYRRAAINQRRLQHLSSTRSPASEKGILSPYFMGHPPLFRSWGSNRVLDVGTGAGSYALTMQALGWQVTGLEPAQRPVERLQDRLRGKVYRTALPGPDLPEPAFDLITLWEVLEHCPQPLASLAWIRRHLRPDGWLMLSVPNAASWSAQTFGSCWLGWDLPRHLCHFDTASLSKLIQASGFTIEHKSTIGHPAWVVRSARRWQRVHRKSACRAPVPHPKLSVKMLTQLPPDWYRWRPLASWITAWATKQGQGDCLLIVARPT